MTTQDGAALHPLDETLRYLDAHGFGDGYLRRARAAIAARQETPFTFDPLESRYCDFCFTALMGGEYDRLRDGRDRCLRCSRTVVDTSEAFVELFDKTRTTMQTAFSIVLDAPVVVRMANAKEIARRTGERFQATPGVDARTLGFAEQTRDGYTLFIENGAPKVAAMTVMAHELTHIWQYLTWDPARIVAVYGEKNRLAVYEGMATWAQVQFLLFLREFGDARRQDAYASLRDDDYGIGYRIFRDRYPMNRDGSVDDDTPFRHPLPL